MADTIQPNTPVVCCRGQAGAEACGEHAASRKGATSVGAEQRSVEQGGRSVARRGMRRQQAVGASYSAQGRPSSQLTRYREAWWCMLAAASRKNCGGIREEYK